MPPTGIPDKWLYHLVPKGPYGEFYRISPTILQQTGRQKEIAAQPNDRNPFKHTGMQEPVKKHPTIYCSSVHRFQVPLPIVLYCAATNIVSSSPTPDDLSVLDSSEEDDNDSEILKRKEECSH